LLTASISAAADRGGIALQDHARAVVDGGAQRGQRLSIWPLLS
jgi:hypothetical protein